MIRSHVLICGGTGCTSSGSMVLKTALEKELEAKGREADTNTTSERTEEKQTQNNELEKAD